MSPEANIKSGVTYLITSRVARYNRDGSFLARSDKKLGVQLSHSYWEPECDIYEVDASQLFIAASLATRP
jgi:hypothetical protein